MKITLDNYIYSRVQAELAYVKVYKDSLDNTADIPDTLLQLREDLLSMANRSHSKWQLDWRIALDLHASLPISPSTASAIGFWHRLNIHLVPELFIKRWDINPGNYFETSKKDRLFDRTRNYLGSLWWLVEILTPQATSECQISNDEKSQILGCMTTDNIVGIVERSGNGYDGDVIRAICKRIFLDNKIHNRDHTLRKILKLNNAWTLNVDPMLVEGGLETYIDRLFEKALNQ